MRLNFIGEQEASAVTPLTLIHLSLVLFRYISPVHTHLTYSTTLSWNAPCCAALRSVCLPNSLLTARLLHDALVLSSLVSIYDGAR